MITRLPLWSAALIVMASSTTAVAQGLPTDPAALFAKADRNGDGSVSRAEFMTARADTFDALDRNRNGSVEVTELTAIASGPMEQIEIRLGFGSFDQNRDGRLSRRELATGPAPGFDRADANHDGTLSAGEFGTLRRR